MEVPSTNGTGSVLIDIRYGWDGTSVRPNCDGPVSYIRTRNTSNMIAWALLPNKKKGAAWVQIDPGTDTTITAAGQLNNLGLSNQSDVQAVGITFENPA